MSHIRLKNSRDHPYEGCQCSLDGNCNKPPYLNSDPICNCDTMFLKSVDEGYLLQKEALPVMELSYGGSFSPISSIQYILGPLICTGRFKGKISRHPKVKHLWRVDS